MRRMLTVLAGAALVVGLAAPVWAEGKTHPADQTKNPKFNPIHTYHLGIWFDSVAAAVANGCPPNQTVFNGDHTAGPQVLNSGKFPNNAGPLSHID